MVSQMTDIFTVFFQQLGKIYPYSNVHGANMEPIWGRQDPDGPHVGPMNFAIWGAKQASDVHNTDPLRDKSTDNINV